MNSHPYHQVKSKSNPVTKGAVENAPRIIWLHNFFRHFQLIPSPAWIKCSQCKLKQHKAQDWDHQRCSGCGVSLYDER